MLNQNEIADDFEDYTETEQQLMHSTAHANITKTQRSAQNESATLVRKSKKVNLCFYFSNFSENAYYA